MSERIKQAGRLIIVAIVLVTGAYLCSLKAQAIENGGTLWISSQPTHILAIKE